MAQSRLHQWYDQVWNNAKEDSIDDLMDESAVIHGLESAEAASSNQTG